jgi:WD40 repeat protein
VAELKGHKRWVSSVEYGPYGRIIVSGGNDGFVLVWDAATFELRSTIRDGPDPVYSVAINSDESLVAYGCGDSTVRLWSLHDMKDRHVMRGHKDRVDCVSFNLDGSLIASSSRDARICVFHTRTGRLLTNMDGHRGAVHHVRFSPQGSRIFSGSADKTARVWSLPPATEMGGTGRVAINERLNQHFGAVRSLAFGPTNQTLVSASDDTLVKVRAWSPKPETLQLLPLCCFCPQAARAPTLAALLLVDSLRYGTWIKSKCEYAARGTWDPCSASQ